MNLFEKCRACGDDILGEAGRKNFYSHGSRTLGCVILASSSFKMLTKIFLFRFLKIFSKFPRCLSVYYLITF